MAVNVSAKVVNHDQISLYLYNLPDKVNRAVRKGIKRGGEELRDYIKYELLEGKLVKKRTGELQRGIYLVTQLDKVFIRIKGKHATIGAWIDQGLEGTWIIRARRKKILYFQASDGRWIKTTKVTHPGIRPRYFLRKGAQAKRLRIPQLVRAAIREELSQSKNRKRV